MPYIAYLFHLLIILTRATGNPELEAALPYQQIYLETVLVYNQASRDYAKQVGTPPLRFDPIPASCRSGHAFPPIRTGFSHRIHPS